MDSVASMGIYVAVHISGRLERERERKGSPQKQA